MVQNQSGPHPNKWDRSGTVLETHPHDQYRIKMDGSGRHTIRNRRFLKPIVTYTALSSRPQTLRVPTREGEEDDTGSTQLAHTPLLPDNAESVQPAQGEPDQPPQTEQDQPPPQDQEHLSQDLQEHAPQAPQQEEPSSLGPRRTSRNRRQPRRLQDYYLGSMQGQLSPTDKVPGTHPPGRR